MTTEPADWQVKLLTFVPCATAPLSMMGSLLTLLTIYRTRRIVYVSPTDDDDDGDVGGETTVATRNNNGGKRRSSPCCPRCGRSGDARTRRRSTSVTTTPASTTTTTTTTTTKFTTYHRLFIQISFWDCIVSMGLALGPLPIPRETGYFGAYGNTRGRHSIQLIR